MGNYLEDLMIREEYHLAHRTMVQHYYKIVLLSKIEMKIYMFETVSQVIN